MSYSSENLFQVVEKTLMEISSCNMEIENFNYLRMFLVFQSLGWGERFFVRLQFSQLEIGCKWGERGRKRRETHKIYDEISSSSFSAFMCGVRSLVERAEIEEEIEKSKLYELSRLDSFISKIYSHISRNQSHFEH